MSSPHPSGAQRVIALTPAQYATVLGAQLVAAHEKVAALCHELAAFGWPSTRLESFADTLLSLGQPTIDPAAGDLTATSQTLADLAALEVVLARERLGEIDDDLRRVPRSEADGIRVTLTLLLDDLDALDALGIEAVAV